MIFRTWSIINNSLKVFWEFFGWKTTQISVWTISIFWMFSYVWTFHFCQLCLNHYLSIVLQLFYIHIIYIWHSSFLCFNSMLLSLNIILLFPVVSSTKACENSLRQLLLIEAAKILQINWVCSMLFWFWKGTIKCISFHFLAFIIAVAF